MIVQDEVHLFQEDGHNYHYVSTPVVSDGEGNWWPMCGLPECDLRLYGPGRAGCSGLCNGLEGWALPEEEYER